MYKLWILSSFSGFRVVFLIHKINLCWNLGCLRKERKKENWRCKRPEWAIAHFESSVATEKVCRDRVPLTMSRHGHLCRDRAHRPGARLGLCLRDRTEPRLGRARDRNPQPHVATGFLCHDKVRAGTRRQWVATEVFLVVT